MYIYISINNSNFTPKQSDPNPGVATQPAACRSLAMAFTGAGVGSGITG